MSTAVPPNSKWKMDDSHKSDGEIKFIWFCRPFTVVLSVTSNIRGDGTGKIRKTD